MSDPLRLLVCASAGDGKGKLVGLLVDAANARAGHPSIEAEKIGAEEAPGRMAAAASTADAAVLVVDARKGIDAQARKLFYLVSLMAVRHVAVAVDSLDPGAGPSEAFTRIEAECRSLAARLDIRDFACMPVCGTGPDDDGGRIAHPPWHTRITLLEYLEKIAASPRGRDAAFRMPVEEVGAEHDGLPFCSGQVASGLIRTGERIRVLPSGRESTVARIVAAGRDVDTAAAGQQVTLALAEQMAMGPGDLVSSAQAPATVADQFEATLIWTGEHEMLPGRPYLLKIGARAVGVSMATPKHRVHLDSFEHLAARTLHHDEIGVCNINLDTPVAFDPYAENRVTGAFALLDRMTNEVVGTGLLHFALRRSQNVHWQAVEVNKQAHAALKGHKPCVVWFTGLSGAGKSTIANQLEKKLHAMGMHTYLLDGDNVRHGLNKDLGFTEADRVENIRRVAEVARLMADAGLIVLVSFISPFRAERRFARGLLEAGEFCEVFVDTPLAVAEQRERKGLYHKARAGGLKNFTGIDSPYESPEHPEVRIDTVALPAEDAASVIIEKLMSMGVTNRA
jgi:bifunctional enzyme CysN/CysC